MAENFFEMKPTFADEKHYCVFRRTWLDLWLNVKSKVKESLIAQAIKQVSGSFLVSLEQDVGAIFSDMGRDLHAIKSIGRRI